MRSTACLIALAGLLLERASAAGANCSELELIIARGTSEPLNPDFGLIVGDPLFAATKTLIPGVTGYSVNYPASVGCDSAQIGAADTLSHLTAISAACPDQKYVLVGYSQGAGVIHLAAPKIPTSLYDRIVALVMYGDGGNPGPSFSDPPRTTTIPAFPDALNQKLKENCAFGDPVCSNGTSINAHLSYNAPNATYISGSAEYIQQQLQTNGKVGPQLSPNGGAPGPAALAALSSLGSVLGAVAGPTASKCGSGPASTGNATATITTTGSSAPLSSAATVASSAKATFTGGAMRLSPFGFLY